jgi:Major Facilitator Superfamily.
LENLLGYPTLTAGLVMGPRGITSMLSMMLVGRLTGRLDTRLLVGAGILISAFGSYAMTAYDLRIDIWWAIWPILIQGLGLGMIYVPLSTLSLATLKPEQMSEAAGLFSLLRTVGSSIGISIVSTLYTRLGQREWNLLGGHINPFNPDLWTYLHAHGLELSSALTGPLLGRELSRQANMLALINVMEFITWSFLAMLPFVLLVRDVGKTRRPPPVMD